MHTVLTLSVCKRRDAVRLALNKPARPAGAAFGGLFSARRTASRRLQTLNVNTVCIAASGAPLVRSRVDAACSLTSDPLGGRTKEAAAGGVFDMARCRAHTSDAIVKVT